MRIAVYHTQPSGGARRALHGFCTELAKRHELTVYSLTSADREMLDDALLQASVVRFPYARRKAIRGGLYLNDVRRLLDLADLRRINASVAGEIDAARYDVVLVDACRYTFAPYVLRHLKTPTAYYCHHRPRLGEERVAAPSGTVYERARRLVHRPAERLLESRLWREDFALVRGASRVVTNSIFNQRRIREVYEVDAAVCPPGVDVPPPVAPDRRRDHVLSVGELEVRKGHDLVISALGLLPADLRPSLHIVANAGNHTVQAHLERSAATLGVSLSIRTFPSQAELQAEYAEALLFLSGARQEPLGLAPLEAMAAGLPVVAVAEGGFLETVRDSTTGFLVDRDPAALSSRIAALLGNPALRAEMGEAAREHVVANWTWPRRAHALELQLESLT